MKQLKPMMLFIVLLFNTLNAKDLPKLTYSGDNPKVQNPLSPEDSQKHIVTPDGFKAVLFASEPDIINPIAMSWDEKGRCYVLQSVDYPHKLNPKSLKGNDKITICEDTDGDGRADKFKVFANDLSLATGITCVKGGVIVCMAPEMIFLQDSNGDDKYDKRTTLFTGFGLRDTHAGPANIRYGLDNHIWGSVGYSGFKGQVGGKDKNFTMGVYRFSTDGKNLDFAGRFNNNTWGLGLSESFDIFGSTANNNHLVHIGIPQWYHKFVTTNSQPKKKKRRFHNVENIQSHYNVKTILKEPMQQVDVRGGYTAAAGSCLYTARAYPKKYWNRAVLINEPTAAVVHQAFLVKNGAGYKEEDGGNLFASSDMWCSPVFSDVGPEGFVWVADWYNPVIQHNPDRRGMPNRIWNAKRGKYNAHQNPLRDTQHGRIYRVVYKKNSPHQTTQLKKSDTRGLIKALKSDNMFWRTTAQRMIVENKIKSLSKDLVALIKDEKVDDIGMNGAAVHALWTLQGLGDLDGKDKKINQVVYDALTHPSPAVRKAATMVLPLSEESSDALVTKGLLVDKDMGTRLAAILKSAELPKTKKLKQALSSSLKNNPTKDKWIKSALDISHSSDSSTPDSEDNSEKADVSFHIKVIPDKMAFATKELKVKAGQKVKITFENNGNMQHNLVVLLPESLKSFGKKVDQFIKHPSAMKKHYVPDSKAVIAKTIMLDPGKTDTIVFQVPDILGDFPYVCTFPGHWRMMQGVMKVERNEKRPFSILAKTDKAPLVLSVGSGSSHDFARWFGEEDGFTLNKIGVQFDYTPVNPKLDQQISKCDILFLSANQKLPAPAEKEIFKHADSGKSIMINHPSTWYNWKRWPDYNLKLVGGGSKSHEKITEFEVKVIKPEHPLMQDVAKSFKITDELYRWSKHQKNKQASDIEVLAIGKSLKTGKEYPVVWIVQYAKTKIVCNTLGHDGRAHQNKDYKKILENTLKWMLTKNSISKR